MLRAISIIIVIVVCTFLDTTSVNAWPWTPKPKPVVVVPVVTPPTCGPVAPLPCEPATKVVPAPIPAVPACGPAVGCAEEKAKACRPHLVRKCVKAVKKLAVAPLKVLHCL